MAQDTSELWKTLLKTPGTRREYQFDIDGTVYGPDDEVSHNVENGLYEEFGIGNAACAKLDLSIFADDIPRAAAIKRTVRLVNEEQASEWTPAGVYFANRRSSDSGVWTIEAFDGMRKADKEWVPDQSLEFPLPMPEALTVIASEIGVEIDARTQLNPAYTIDYPATGTTYRQVLQWMAAAHGGNFIMNPSGELRLVLAGDLEPEKVTHEVGEDIVSASNNGVMRPISRVTLKVDDENVITAGDDTGMELIADCPYATQEMVDTLLAGFAGYQYQMYSAEAANIDPAAELGDMVEVDGIRSVLAQISDDGSGYPDIAAPGEAEMEDEYPSEGPLTRSFNRKIAQARSAIEKTSEEIRLAIEGFDGRLSEFSVNIESIVSDVEGLDGAFSKLEQTVNGFTYTGPDGKVWINNGNINLTGSITWGDLTSDVQDRVGGVTEEIVHTLIKNDLVESPTIRGANIYGGKFWDEDGHNNMEISIDPYNGADFVLRLNDIPYFEIRELDNGILSFLLWSKAVFNYSPTEQISRPYGSWDFSNATVTGLNKGFSQVSRLTSSNADFYLYITFGGIGVYTPVYAAVLGRTYTCAMSVSAGRTHPIYGMTITVSSSGSVSVSNIYAVYPASEGQSPIAFDLDSFTIYAR